MSAEEPTAAEKRLRERQARAAAAGKAGSVAISGEDALEAVSDLEGKVETWHLAAEKRLSEERIRRDADRGGGWEMRLKSAPRRFFRPRTALPTSEGPSARLGSRVASRARSTPKLCRGAREEKEPLAT